MAQDRIAELEREVRGLQDQLALLGGAVLGAALPGGDPETKLANLLEIADACKFLRSLDRYRQMRGMPEERRAAGVERRDDGSWALDVLTGAIVATVLDDRPAVSVEHDADGNLTRYESNLPAGGGGSSGGAGASASWESPSENYGGGLSPHDSGGGGGSSYDSSSSSSSSDSGSSSSDSGGGGGGGGSD